MGRVSPGNLDITGATHTAQPKKGAFSKENQPAMAPTSQPGLRIP